MSLLNFGRLLLTVVLLCVVSLLFAKKADAGEFSHLIAVVVATDDGQVITVPVDPISLKATPQRINQNLVAGKVAAVAPYRGNWSNGWMRNVSTETVTVCGADGCKEVPVAQAAGCPCDCPECTCDAEAPTPTASEHSILVSSERTYRGPVRGLLGKLGKFIVKGGPIRQALRANRQARRGG